VIAARSAFISLLLALGLAACATRPTTDVNAFARRSASNSFESFDRAVDPSALVLAVVHDRQTSAASCGAHALASIINYWRGPNAAVGNALFEASPPGDVVSGYSLAELRVIALANGLQANAVRLSQADIIAELESGRPVLIPVLAPAVYIEPRTLPGENIPVVGLARNFIIDRAARMSEASGMSMVSHYLVVVGYDGGRFVVLEPVRGFRTIRFERLARYRRPFNDAALVFSAGARAGD
jgi:predicted double-glycine peptidase